MRLEVIKNTLNSNNNIKICMLSDIHYYDIYNLKVFTKILNNIKKNKPDYICIPGDIVDKPGTGKLEYLFDFLKEIGRVAPVIISVGNHDISIENTYIKNKEFFDELRKVPNIHLLDNEELIINNIRFIGYTEDLQAVIYEKDLDKLVVPDLNKLLLNIDSKYPNILLAHNPINITKKEVYSKITKWNYLTAILCGHTHGGLTSNLFKGNWGFVSPYKHKFIKVARGLYKCLNVPVIICSGTIKLSYASGLYRYLNFIFPISINYIKFKRRT